MTASGRERRISLQQRIRPAPFRGNRIKGWVLEALDLIAVGSADLRILVVGDAEMARWNRRFLGRSGTTNVLSFPEEDSVGPSRGSLRGDILVSAPVCLGQTEGWPESPEGRLFFFILHGILHLRGYDHLAGPVEAARMRRTELRVFRQILLRSSGQG